MAYGSAMALEAIDLNGLIGERNNRGAALATDM